MSPYAAGDSELALEVAGAYQEIGMLYQYGYRDRALHAFTNAALMLAGIAAGDPSEGPYRAQWIAVDRPDPRPWRRCSGMDGAAYVAYASGGHSERSAARSDAGPSADR